MLTPFQRSYAIFGVCFGSGHISWVIRRQIYRKGLPAAKMNPLFFMQVIHIRDSPVRGNDGIIHQVSSAISFLLKQAWTDPFGLAKNHGS
jgi:hypothetical protein